ncbi:copper resistance protein CopC [Actinomadura sp. WMMA1423]|uniref:copper resistance CopC family protein n=1 Tax=Actinomadura sp. WMMA1423 TaxID=2591108 RepID=UPI001146AB85|nr:copper resistance protein CopC [Actinomadura sp. WMMA1423]
MNMFKSRRPLRRLGLIATAALAFGAFTAPPALAHTKLVGSTPEKGKAADSVTEVTLVFSDKISVAKVVVSDGQKKEFQAGAAERAGTKVTQKLTGPLPAGSYTVAYRVVGEDGHPIEGDDLAFSVTGGGEPAASAAPSEGGVGAAEQTGAAANADEQPLKADQEDADSDEDSGPGMLLWVLIGVGLLVGVGIGVAIVFRAKRKHQAATGGE